MDSSQYGFHGIRLSTLDAGFLLRRSQAGRAFVGARPRHPRTISLYVDVSEVKRLAETCGWIGYYVPRFAPIRQFIDRATVECKRLSNAPQSALCFNTVISG